MKKFLQNNYKIIITILLLCSLMFYYNTRKNGFHEDEMYSYGSSNYRYDNVFQPYGYATANNDYLFNHVLQGSFWNQTTNIINYIIHPGDYVNKYNQTLKEQIPTWKTKEEAKEYLTIEKEDIWNFASIWYNQLCDIHPPMFYNVLHIFSIFFLNNFSKYIGFFLNLLFFIITLISIHKIMKVLKKEKLSIPTMILYGGSMGAISTVIFQRMYMMLTCFSTIYLYYALKFFKQENFSRKDIILWSLTILLGFLTQYYFCIYIVIIFLTLSFFLYQKRQKKEWKQLFLIHLIPALLGILYFPSCIEDIFFSYRGIGATQDHTKTFLEMLIYYVKGLFSSYSIPKILIIIFIIYFLIKLWKNHNNLKKGYQNLPEFLLCFLPIPFFILIISKIAPFLGNDYTTRYIMLLFPSIAIIIIWILNDFFTTQKKYTLLSIFAIFLTIYGCITKTPPYLYERYDEVIQIAEENQEKYFIYIFDNTFTHLSSMPEFMTYQKSLIINYQEFDFTRLQEDSELKNQKEIILCIKNWLNTEELLNQILKNTEFTKTEKLLDIKEDINSTYFRLSKN